MNNKEYKAWLNNLTLGEIKTQYYHMLDNVDLYKNSIQNKAIKLSQLDIDDKSYYREMEELVDGMKTTKGFLKDALKCADMIKPILDKKEIEGINQEEYERYMSDNRDNIQILIKAVQDKEKEFIDNGCKILVCVNKKETKEIVISEKEAHEIHNDLLKETVLILKDNVGNIKKVEKLEYNNNSGFDCTIQGNKGTIDINTILAGGYNKQCLHYRTLVQRW